MLTNGKWKGYQIVPFNLKVLFAWIARKHFTGVRLLVLVKFFKCLYFWPFLLIYSAGRFIIQIKTYRNYCWNKIHFLMIFKIKKMYWLITNISFWELVWGLRVKIDPRILLRCKAFIVLYSGGTWVTRWPAGDTWCVTIYLLVSENSCAATWIREVNRNIFALLSVCIYVNVLVLFFLFLVVVFVSNQWQFLQLLRL